LSATNPQPEYHLQNNVRGEPVISVMAASWFL
jgi:hypothetical protein